jgi:uncharacterized protein YjiK
MRMNYGVNVLREVTLNAQDDDVSMGRFTNGTGSFVFMTTPTPLMANQMNSPNLAINDLFNKEIQVKSSKRIQTFLSSNFLIALFLIPQTTFAAVPDAFKIKNPTGNVQNGRNIKYDRKDEYGNKIGLKEPSGLTLSHGKNALWTVSDDTSKIFKLELNGELKEDKTIELDGLKGMEGIAIGNYGDYLYVVIESDVNENVVPHNEMPNRIVKVDIAGKSIVDDVKLEDLTGYWAMRANLIDKFNRANKGLEGITVDPLTDSIYLLMESGVLIEVSDDLSEITNYYDLNFGDDVDYSGICFEDVERNRVWITSDKSKKMYLFDIDTEEVKGDPIKLRDDNGNSYESSEGVAFDPDTDKIFIVTDEGHTLFQYKVQY